MEGEFESCKNIRDHEGIVLIFLKVYLIVYGDVWF
jgi:hypothetical protein